ncbi:MAG: hypothetical protein HND48_27090 [Chloroflexi bacterium]|nr:hypothetical protein [Chloroflexota bacterium]
MDYALVGLMATKRASTPSVLCSTIFHLENASGQLIALHTEIRVHVRALVEDVQGERLVDQPSAGVNRPADGRQQPPVEKAEHAYDVIRLCGQVHRVEVDVEQVDAAQAAAGHLLAGAVEARRG